MPPKPDPQPETKTDKKIGSLTCGVRGPGPKYKLKTLVGYEEHCISKYRNPAYTFGIRHPSLQPCVGPGPKYLLPADKRVGFTFGVIGKTFDTSCGPGPKYFLPSPKGLAFTLKSRTEGRKSCFTPGPYSIKFPIQGPAFYIGRRLPALKCDPVPGPRLYNDRLVRQRSPTYHIAYKVGGKEICRSPGPKYYFKSPKPHPMSFGIKHSECAPPYIVECDNQC
ncbi:unnamed protein product [Xylocopa violacea]|uniref:Uncharacterized protein n=1 Tax=Xylocopa violacea TaxID=135666 RepID=A0ABP1PF46_XYLVO